MEALLEQRLRLPWLPRCPRRFKDDNEEAVETSRSVEDRGDANVDDEPAVEALNGQICFSHKLLQFWTIQIKNSKLITHSLSLSLAHPTLRIPGTPIGFLKAFSSFCPSLILLMMSSHLPT